MSKRKKIQAPRYRGPSGIMVVIATRGISGFWDAWKGHQLPPHWEDRIYPDYDLLRGRNAAVQMLLESDKDYLLFMDDDHWFSHDFCARLLAHEKDVVGPLVLSRYPPFRPTAHLDGQKIRWQGETGLVQVDAIGCAGMLVHRRVFEALTMHVPVFDKDGNVEREQDCWFRAGAKYPDRISEDVDFCDRAREAGFEIHCDLSTRMGHFVQTCVFPAMSEARGSCPGFAFPGDYVMQGTFNYEHDLEHSTPLPVAVPA